MADCPFLAAGDVTAALCEMQFRAAGITPPRAKGRRTRRQITLQVGANDRFRACFIRAHFHELSGL